MGYQRLHDEEPTRVSEIACINDGEGPSYALSLTTTDLTVNDLAPNIYRAFLEGMDPSLTVALTTRRQPDATGVTLPVANTWGGTPTDPEGSEHPVAIFPGNTMVRVRVMAGKQTLIVRMISGTGTLYLVPTIPGL